MVAPKIEEKVKIVKGFVIQNRVRCPHKVFTEKKSADQVGGATACPTVDVSDVHPVGPILFFLYLCKSFCASLRFFGFS
jgi:hypothetical protein